MKYRIEMEPLAGRYVAAFKDPATGKLVKAMAFNGSAAEMLKLYVEGNDISSIAHKLSEQYGVDPDRIAADATAFFRRLDLE